MTDLDGTGTGVLWFHCGAERFHELQEIEGIIASPYLAKAWWVTMERWDVLRPREIEEQLRSAHALIFAKLPKRTAALLEMPEKERKKAMAGRKIAHKRAKSGPVKAAKSSKSGQKTRSVRSNSGKRA